jgi:predicted  nucleic acid-binding Zn ribbon protein
MCALSYNPLHCMDCNLEVRPESLGLDVALTEAIAQWRSVYGAMERLWLDSREYESWAERELEDIRSPVNQRGLELRRRLDPLRRCYYWLHQDESTENLGLIRECPLCSRALISYDGGIFPQVVCNDCSVVIAVLNAETLPL